MNLTSQSTKNNSSSFAASCLRVSILCSCLLLFTMTSAQAATITWKTAGNGNWADPNSWFGSIGYPNAIDDIAIFDNSQAAGNKTVTLPTTGITIGSLNFVGAGAGATTTTISSGTLNFQSSGIGGSTIKYQGSNHVNITSVVSLANDLSIEAGNDSAVPSFTGTLTISGSILGNGHDLAVNSGNPLATTVLSGVISGNTTRLIKSGGGTLILSNSNNSFGGGIDITSGKIQVTFANAVGAGTVIGGGIVANQNYLGSGALHIGNPGAVLELRSASAAGSYNNHVDLNGGNHLLEAGGSLLLNEMYTQNAYRLNLNSGVLDGGTYATKGNLNLVGTDLVYNANGAGGSTITNALDLILNTGTAISANNNMSVTMNNTAMLGRFGTVRKLGDNALTFSAGDTGTFRATDFIISSASGAINFNQTALDLTNGITFSGSNGVWNNALVLPTGTVSMGRDNQLTGSSTLLLAPNATVIANIFLNNTSQTFNNIIMGNGSRLGLWFDPANTAATPRTLTLGSLSAASSAATPLGINYLSIYNWAGKPNSHLVDGTVVANGNIVKKTGTVDLSKVWFRGFDPGAVDLGGGVLAPVDYLHTTAINATNSNWFDYSTWSVDVPNYAGATVTLPNTLPLGGYIYTGANTVTLGHIVTDKTTSAGTNSLGIGQQNTGTMVFNSGVSGSASTISGVGGVNILSDVVLNNKLIINNTGVYYNPNNPSMLNGAGVNFTRKLTGSGDLEIRGNGLVLNSSVTQQDYTGYTGNIDLYSRLTLYGNSVPLDYNFGGKLILEQGSTLYGGYNFVSNLKSKFEIAGDFTANALYFDYAGDVALTADRSISLGGFSNLHAQSGDAGFGPNTNLVGTGGLTIKLNGIYALLNSANNSFSGGFTLDGVNSGRYLVSELTGDLVTGAQVANKNYWGSGDITIKGGTLEAFNNGHAVTLGGNISLIGNVNSALVIDGSGASTITGNVNMTGAVGNSEMQFNNGGDLTIAPGATWDVVSGFGNLRFSGNLDANASFANASSGTGYVNLYSRPAQGSTVHIRSTQPGGIVNINALYKEAGYGGVTSLDTAISAQNVYAQAGTLLLNGDDLIKVRRDGAARAGLVMEGGLLQTAGGASAASPFANRFNTLNVTANSGIYLNDHSALYFNFISTWDTTLASPYTLNLANSTGVWSNSANKTASDTYIYFPNASAVNAARLGLISFTGYGTGAELVQTSVGGTNFWFLAPTGEQAFEWGGARDSGVDTNRLWSTGANWIGNPANGSVTGAGRSIAIRDVDGLLNANKIILDQDATVGKLYIESAGGQKFAISGTNGKVLTFDSGTVGTAAAFYNRSSHDVTISPDLKLNSNLALANEIPTGATPDVPALTLLGKISGSGGITMTGAGKLVMGTTNASGTSNSDFTGGFKRIGSTLTDYSTSSYVTVISANGSLFGSGSYNGTSAAGSIQSLTFGDGTPNRWYNIRTDAPAAPTPHDPSLGKNYVVDASLRIAGNLSWAVDANLAGVSSTITFQSNNPGYVESGTWTLVGGGPNTTLAIDRVSLTIKQDLQGQGGLMYDGRVIPSSYHALYLYGNNTFAGDFIFGNSLANSVLGIGSDHALGNGVIRFNTSSTYVENLSSLDGPRIIPNQIDIPVGASGNTQWNGTFTLNYSGTSFINTNYNANYPQFRGWSIAVGNLTLADSSTLPGLVVITANHEISGIGGIYKNGGGTLRLEGANSYQGNTQLVNGAIQVGNNLSLGSTGTLIFPNTGLTITLASYGGAVTLPNDVQFDKAAGTFNLDGSAGLLTLDAAHASTLTVSPNFTVTGSVAFGQNLALSGAYGITKSGSGVLTLNSATSTYSGTTNITQGTLRVNATGDITVGASDPGKNYLGTGAVNFGSVNYARLLELVTPDGSNVNLIGNLALTGNSTTYTASINVTDTADAISGANIKTYLGGASNNTISGNAFGYLRSAGDLIKVGSGTTTWSGGNLVAPNLLVSQGVLDLSNSTDSRTGLSKLTIGNATLSIAGNHNFTDTAFALAGSGTINMNGGGIVTFKNVGGWSGSLDIVNWKNAGGSSTYGNGPTQFRFSTNVFSAFDQAMLASIQFHDIDSSLDYIAGGKLVSTNSGTYYEVLPAGLNTTWNGQGVGNGWDIGNNWVGGVAPNGIGSYATFSSTLNLGGAPVTQNIAGLTLGGMVFKNNAGETYSISGQAITMQQGDSLNNAVIRLENNNNVSIATSGLILNSNLTVATLGSGTLTFATPVSGSKGLVKSGSGVLVMAAGSQDSNFSGGVTLLEGTIATALDSSGSVTSGPLGTGTLTVAGSAAPSLALTKNGSQTINNNINLDTQLGGTPAQDVTVKLDTAAGNSSTLNGTISQSGTGLGGITKTGAGTLALTASNSYNGPTVMNQGVLIANNANALGNGDVNFSGASTLQSGTDNVAIKGSVGANSGVSGTIDTGAYNMSVAQGVDGAGTVAKIGSGTLAISGTGDLTGTFNAAQGTTKLANAGALGNGSLLNSSTVDLAFSATGVFANKVSGTGVTKITGAEVLVKPTGMTDNDAYSGTWQIASVAKIEDGSAFGANSKVLVDGTLNAAAIGGGMLFNNALSGSGKFNNNGQGIFAFGSATGTNFAGLFNQNSGTFMWDANGSKALASATISANGGMTTVTSGSQASKGFTFNGGTAGFTGTVFTQDFAISSSGGKVLFDDSVLTSRSLLQQDEAVVNGLVVAQNWSGNVADLGLVTAAGVPVGTTSTIALQGGAMDGYYNNNLSRDGNTLNLNYQLTELNLKTTGTLMGDLSAPAGANNMTAKISGSGNLQINASNAITLTNSGNTFTGTTTVVSGTLKGGATDVIKTSGAVVLNNNTAFDLGAYNQQVQNLSGNGNTLLGSNTLTVSSTMDTNYGGAIGGNGVLVKSGSSTLTVSGSSNYNGGTQVDSGTLKLTNANGLGSGTANVVSSLDLSVNGTVANNIGGSGTAFINGGTVSLGGTNNISAWVVNGIGAASGTQNLGTGSVLINNGGNLFLNGSAGVWDFVNDLTGSGTLTGNLGSGTLTMNPSSGTSFAGVIEMKGGLYQLDANGHNALQSGTLKLSASGSTEIYQSGSIKGLEIAGGVLKVQTSGVDNTLSGTLTVTDLTVSSGTIAMNRPDSVVDDTNVTTALSFFDQTGTVQQMIVRAVGTVTGVGVQLDMTDYSGNLLANPFVATVRDSGSMVTGTASYNYYASVTGSGIYWAYGLTELYANQDANITLSNSNAIGQTLGVKLTGPGGYIMSGTGVYDVGNLANSYSGSTFVSTGTVRALTDNSFGQTALLDIASDGGVDLNGKTQTIGAFSGSAGGSLDLNNGTLTISGTTGNSISDGTLTGSGSLIVQSNTLTINGANTGLTANINLGGSGTAASLQLNNIEGAGNSGTITFADNASLLALNASGTLSKVLSGQGSTEVFANHDVTLVADNSGFSGTFTVQNSSTLHASVAENLGSAAISGSNGSLQLHGFNGALVNDLQNDLTLQLSDSSVVTIDRANSQFSGSAIVDANNQLAIKDELALNNRPITDNGLVVMDYSGSWNSVISGSGNVQTLQDLTVTTTQSYTGTTLIDAGTLTAKVANAVATADMNIKNGAAFAMNNLDQGVKNLNNNGTVDFGDHGIGSFRTLTVNGNFSGKGLVKMNAAIGTDVTPNHSGDIGAAGDLIRVNDGAVSGTQQLIIKRNGGNSLASKDGVQLLLVESNDSSAGNFNGSSDNIHQYSGSVDVGMRSANVQRGDLNGANTNNWYLVLSATTINSGSNGGGDDGGGGNNGGGDNGGGGNNGGQTGSGGHVVLCTAESRYIAWFDQDTLVKRMGELRLNEGIFGDLNKEHDWDVWVRSYGSQYNLRGEDMGHGNWQIMTYGVDIGADKVWNIDNRNVLYTGVFGGYGRADLDVKSGMQSTGGNDNYSAGFYGTWLHDTGWYADLVGKTSYFDNDFKAHDMSMNSTNGDYGTWAAGVSLEFGRQFQFKDGWYAEPQVQASYAHFFGGNYTTSGDNSFGVSVGDTDVLQLRFGSLLGRSIKLTQDAKDKSFLQPYVKVFGVEQISDGGYVNADGGQWRPNTDGMSAIIGCGLIYQLDANNQLHLDYEAQFSDKYDKPFGINFGYRHQF